MEVQPETQGIVRVADLTTTSVSTRESEVLTALGEHLINAEIAQRLHISMRTVESHVSSLLRKPGSTDRLDLHGTAASLRTDSRRRTNRSPSPR